MDFQQLRIALKKNKIFYYAHNLLRQIFPRKFYEQSLNRRLAALNKYDAAYITDRVNYYNKLSDGIDVGPASVALRDMKIFQSPKAYNFDTFEYTRYFPGQLKANFLFGDVIHTPDHPTIQKSRPVNGNNSNAVLLKLDKKRHYVFIKDNIRFADKKDQLIGRGAMTQPHRVKFMEMYFGHPLCDLGQVNPHGGNPNWIKPKITVAAHLQYKFILSIEGHDVATNLKWVMSSNSVAVMPKPRYETWFMEGRLIPDYHYICINDDFTNLEEKLRYYINHPHEAETIAKNANAYIKQFLNKPQEDLISLMVLQKYFRSTGQL